MESKLPVKYVTQSFFEYIPNKHTEHFSCRYALLQFRHIMIQVLVIESVDYLLFKNSFKLFQVEQKPGCPVNYTGKSNFKQIVMTVAMFITAFSINCNVFIIRQIWVK